MADLDSVMRDLTHDAPGHATEVKTVVGLVRDAGITDEQYRAALAKNRLKLNDLSDLWN